MRRERVWSAHGWLERARAIDTRRCHISYLQHTYSILTAYLQHTYSILTGTGTRLPHNISNSMHPTQHRSPLPFLPRALAPLGATLLATFLRSDEASGWHSAAWRLGYCEVRAYKSCDKRRKKLDTPPINRPLAFHVLG